MDNPIGIGEILQICLNIIFFTIISSYPAPVCPSLEHGPKDASGFTYCNVGLAWQDAHDVCRQNGGNLAAVTTSTLVAAAGSLMTSFGGGVAELSAWVDGVNLGSDVWFWNGGLTLGLNICFYFI